jgi:hypothetical protein
MCDYSLHHVATRLTRLCEGQRATVLQLPAASRPADQQSAAEQPQVAIREPLHSS